MDDQEFKELVLKEIMDAQKLFMVILILMSSHHLRRVPHEREK
ncbi:MAG: hypothetical protein ACLR7Z_18020 [Bilophila wadsworthia]